MSAPSREEIVARLTQRTTEIMGRMPQLEVVQTLALHISIDPQFLNSAAIFITQCMSKNRDATLEEQIAQMFEDIFLLPMRFEVATSKASNGSIDGFVYPFGADRSLLSFPIKLFRSSMTAYACVARLLNEPGHVPEGSSFGKVQISSENSTINYSNFQFDATFNAVFSRFSLVCALCTSLCATSRVAQASNPGSNDFKLMRVLVHGALTRLSNRLAKLESTQTKRNINTALLVKLSNLIAVCESLDTFHSVKLMQVAATHYQELCQKHSVRVGIA